MSRKRFDLAVFDFDGTLADTRQAVAATINETLVHFGHSPVAPELVHPHIGLPLQTIFRPLVAVDDVTPFATRYRERYEAVARQTTRLVEGVDGALRDLRAAGVRLAVATSENHEVAVGLLEALGVRSLFDEVAADGKKPDPEVLLGILSNFGVSSHRAVMVGDTVFDVVMGRRAGTSTCAVTYGFQTREHLASEHPTFLVDSPRQWVDVLSGAPGSA